MNDMASVIIPKSDQINADDLIAGPITVTIRDVQIKGGQEQPVSIGLVGHEKVYRPCKSMSRVLVAMWGPDAKKYVGKSMTLYRDPAVKWGGMAVGGIRISHMSDIAEAKTMALTETRAQRKPFTVKPLANAPAPTSEEMTLALAEHALRSAATLDDLKTAWSRKNMAPHRATLQGVLDECKALLSFDAPRPDTLTPDSPHAEEGPADEDRGETFTDDETAVRLANAEAFIAGYVADLKKARTTDDLARVHAGADEAAARIRREFPDLYAEKLAPHRPADAPEAAVDELFEGRG